MNQLTLDFVGEFDTSNVVDMAARLDEAISLGPAHLVLNMTEVTFLDSTTLNELIHATKRCQKAAIRLSLQPSNVVTKLLVITGTDVLFCTDP
jgi:anti-anti-sigma factor